MNGNRTPWSTCMSTVPEARTDTAIGTGEFDLDHGITATVLGGRPALAGTSLGAGYLLLRPINLKLVRRKAFAFPCLTLLVTACGPVKINVVVPFALDQEFGLHITGIHQVAIRQKLLVLQSFVNERNDLTISGGGSGGLDMGDQVQLVLLATLRQVHLVADPRSRVLFGIVGLRIIRRADHEQT